jgi:uncharacterized membrane protein
LLRMPKITPAPIACFSFIICITHILMHMHPAASHSSSTTVTLKGTIFLSVFVFVILR